MTPIGRCFIELHIGCKLVRERFDATFSAQCPFATIFTDYQTRFDTFGSHTHHHADADFFHICVEIFTIDLLTERKQKGVGIEFQSMKELKSYIVPTAYESFDTTAVSHIFESVSGSVG